MFTQGQSGLESRFVPNGTLPPSERQNSPHLFLLFLLLGFQFLCSPPTSPGISPFLTPSLFRVLLSLLRWPLISTAFTACGCVVCVVCDMCVIGVWCVCNVCCGVCVMCDVCDVCCGMCGHVYTMNAMHVRIIVSSAVNGRHNPITNNRTFNTTLSTLLHLNTTLSTLLHLLYCNAINTHGLPYPSESAFPSAFFLCIRQGESVR